jgi:hypothetical protein
MKVAKYILPLLLAFVTQVTVAQTNHLVNFDKHRFHYGIGLGVTDIKFDIDLNQDDEIRSHMRGIESYYAPGFHLYIIGDMRITSFMNLRLIPGITLVERNMHYNWNPTDLSADHRLDEQRNVETVFADVPLELKIRAWRWRNFRPYLVGGGKYSFDFASLKNNKNKDDQSIVRLKTSEFSYTVGAGFDFYLLYFKLAIELKMNFGITDQKIPDDTYYTTAINGMNTRAFLLTITVEG